MSNILVTSFLPFPNIFWWANAIAANSILFDGKEHYVKMSYRNRYYLAGANNTVLLSIPLTNGRNQRTAMEDVQISNAEDWQTQHWRTLFSIYNRSPYFQHYAHELEFFFRNTVSSLAAFNKASIDWVKEKLNLNYEEIYATEFRKDYEAKVDLREMRPAQEQEASAGFPEYQQVFSERTGFVPNMSILDLLFAEGPYTKEWLKKNRDTILLWKA